MTLKITNIRKRYVAPYAEMVACDNDECMLDAISTIGDNPEFAKGMNGIWDDGGNAGESDGINNIFRSEQ